MEVNGKKVDEKVVLDIVEEQFHVDVWNGEEKCVQEHFEAQLHVDDLSDDERNTPAKKVIKNSYISFYCCSSIFVIN